MLAETPDRPRLATAASTLVEDRERTAAIMRGYRGCLDSLNHAPWLRKVTVRSTCGGSAPQRMVEIPTRLLSDRRYGWPLLTGGVGTTNPVEVPLVQTRAGGTELSPSVGGIAASMKVRAIHEAWLRTYPVAAVSPSPTEVTRLLLSLVAAGDDGMPLAELRRSMELLGLPRQDETLTELRADPEVYETTEPRLCVIHGHTRRQHVLKLLH